MGARVKISRKYVKAFSHLTIIVTKCKGAVVAHKRFLAAIAEIKTYNQYLLIFIIMSASDG